MTTTLFGKHKDESLFRTNKSGLSKHRCRLELYSQGEYSGFKVTGIIEGFFSIKEFFLVGNFGKFF